MIESLNRPKLFSRIRINPKRTSLTSIHGSGAWPGFSTMPFFFLLLLSTRKLFHGQLPFGGYDWFIPFEFFVWIPIEAFLLEHLGDDAGKVLSKNPVESGQETAPLFYDRPQEEFFCLVQRAWDGRHRPQFFLSDDRLSQTQIVAYNELGSG